MGSQPTPASVASPIIRRKILVPPLSQQLVNRPRLVRHLLDALDTAQVVIVSAAAGSGKTTAVAKALESRWPTRTAWLTLDRTDTAPGRLLLYLESAIAEVDSRVTGVGHTSVAAGAPLAEAAGLLASTVAGRPTVLVLDQLEALGNVAAAWDVIENLMRYAPPELQLVMISRKPLPATLCSPPPMTPVAFTGDRELAFDVVEAAEALALLDAEQMDPAEAVAATGGWVTGILFEAWHSGDHVRGAGGELDPLHGYLAAHLLSGLSAELHEFLISTALLSEVTVAGARALGLKDVSARFAELRQVHLPAVLDLEPMALRCHSRFREYLLARLEERPDGDVRELRLNLARLHASAGQHEEAVEELLAVGASGEAVVSADKAILAVIERGDLALAERWLDVLLPSAPLVSDLTTAELMLAIVSDDFTRARSTLDRLEASGDRDVLAATSERAATMMSWCYMHEGQTELLNQVLRIAPHTPAMEAVRYASSMITDPLTHTRRGAPPLRGVPSDGLILIADATLGQQPNADESAPQSKWVGLVADQERIGVLRTQGRLAEALALYDEALEQETHRAVLDIYLGPELLVDAKLIDRARAAIENGRRVAAATGSLGYQALNALAAAKFELRLMRDPAAALAVLDDIERLIAGREFRLISATIDMWHGYALLLQSQHRAGAVRLRRATRSMVAGNRLLELPAAAVYLSEAEWRLGNPDAADRAAELALQSADESGTSHTLLQALQDVPAVASRCIDAEARADERWHALGRTLLHGNAPPHVVVRERVSGPVHLRDLGSPQLLVDGVIVQPRIAKSYELLAFLATHFPDPVRRDAVLTALFGCRPAGAASTYLRQAVYHLRQALPDPSDLLVGGGEIKIRTGVVVQCDSVDVEAVLAEARRLSGQARLDKTGEAVALSERGDYLWGIDSPWVAQRREQLATSLTDAHFEAAELSLTLGSFAAAQRHCATVLDRDPYREPAWRLQMRIHSALGDDAGVIRAYQGCSEILADLGATPARGTKQLLDQLRR